MGRRMERNIFCVGGGFVSIPYTLHFGKFAFPRPRAVWRMFSQ
jgi:hypothetical protein